MELFGSICGLIAFPFLAWLFSNNRGLFPWRVVIWAIVLQIALAFFVLKSRIGQWIFQGAHIAVNKLISFANDGAQMVFGPLANRTLLEQIWGPSNASIFLVTVSSTIILVSALSSLLYHWRILPKIVTATANIMRWSLKTSGSESLAAAANIFMGMTEAPLLIRPYLAGMTRSELFALMTSGMATIAGGVLAAYVSFGISAGHLITASVLSAPAALMMAKIMIPETQTSETAAGASITLPHKSVNFIDALCQGAADGVKLSINVMGMLIAFVAVVSISNFVITLVQTFISSLIGIYWKPINLQQIIGLLNVPLALLMGIPFQDVVQAGWLLGERIVLNEFISYMELASLKDQLADRSFVLITYALCGFANFGSIAIQIGGIGALIPERREQLAQLGIKSMIAGLLACYFTASLVGLLL